MTATVEQKSVAMVEFKIYESVGIVKFDSNALISLGIRSPALITLVQQIVTETWVRIHDDRIIVRRSACKKTIVILFKFQLRGNLENTCINIPHIIKFLITLGLVKQSLPTHQE